MPHREGPHRPVALGTVALLAAALLNAFAAPASAAPTRPAPPHPQRDSVVTGHSVAARPLPAGRGGPPAFHAPAPSWPAAADITLAVPATATPAVQAVRAGTSPVWLTAPRAGTRTATAAAGQMSIHVYDHHSATAAGVDGLLVRLASLGGPERLTVGLDYSGVAGAFGADWASRLRVVELSGCTATDPVPTGCHATVLPTGHDLAAHRITATVAIPPATSTPAASLAVGGPPRPGTGGVVLAAQAGSGGGSGSFAATSLKPSSSWSAGSGTGSFTWSYPLTVPPGLGGPTPSVALEYDSSAVDGEQATTNNQPSWIGEGFSYDPGYIERSYIGCGQDMGGGANNTTATGDLCYSTNNATMSLPGHGGGELLQDASDGNRWHMRGDDGTYVRHLTGAGNGAQNGEYWLVTTTDGSQFYFGSTPSANSTWTEPVYGNNSGEPCHQATFAASSCTQGYRWNLDKVVDPSGNTMTLHYATESGSYAADNDTNTLVSYIRAGHLTEIDYGTRTGGTGSAPMRVTFSTGNRCVTSSCGTHDATNWPDTPWDQQCTATPCYNTSPTFWSTMMLNSISTQLYSGTGTTYTTVNTWTLTHSFADPGDGTRAGLWLASIQQTGHDGGVTTNLPAITFDSVQMANRVEPTNGLSPMNWLRVAKITTETGSQIQVTYSGQDCVSGSRMPDVNHLENNTYRCYPVIWTQPGQQTPTTEFFHKYVVTGVNVADLTTPGNPTTVTSYEYEGTPAWHWTDDNGLVAPNTKTWSVWRGYAGVKTTVGVGAEATTTETRYFQGMNGDHLPSGTRSASMAAIDLNGNGSTTDAVDAPAVVDDDAFAGFTRETLTWNGTDLVSATVNGPWESAPTATRTVSGITVNARIVEPTADVRTETVLDGGRPPRTTSTHTDFDPVYGLPTKVSDNGDDAVTGDEQCTQTSYDRHTTTDGSTWLVNLPSRVQKYAASCATVAAGNLTADQVISDTLSYFDGATSTTTPPTRGLVTRTDTLKDWVNHAPVYLTSATTGYDANGRATSATDVRGNTTTTAFTANAGGQVVTTTATTQLGWVTTTGLDPATGAPLSVTDPNGRVTATAYDGLGRVTGIWKPGRDKATQAANITYAYLIRNNAPDVVTTNTLVASGGYVTSYTLYDGLLRQRQTQAPRGDGTAGALITDTLYDTAGRAYLTYAPYLAAVTPGTSLFVANQLADVPRYTLTGYDRAGRTTSSTVYVNSTGTPAVFAVTTTAHGGDRVDTTPPTGGTATSTVTDARGNIVALRQYHGPTATPSTAGSYDTTTYTFDDKGRQTKVTDPAGNTWTTTYDVMGRAIATTDPNKGATTNAFDDAGDLVSTTDARGVQLSYAYDSLGRRIGAYQGTVTPANQLSAWTYDGLTNSRGQLTKTTTFVGGSTGSAYVMSILGLTASYKPSVVSYTIPAAETGLAGTYTYSYTYNVDDSPATVREPTLDGGQLGAETLTYGYTGLGRAYSLSTSLPTATTLVPSVAYTGYGEVGVVTLQYNNGSSAYLQDNYTVGTRTLAEQLVTRTVTPTTLSDVHYSYDASGNPTSIDDSAGGDNQCFAYDYLDRLASAWTPAGGDCTTAPSLAGLGGPAPYWNDWTFNATGDRTTQVAHDTAQGVATTAYTTPAAGTAQPHTLTGTSTTDGTGTHTASYGYDAIGDTTSRPDGSGGTQALTWDPQGHLATLTDGAASNSYLYDVNGDRLISRDATGKTLYLPGQQLRYTGSGGAKATTRYYTEAGLTVAMRTSSALTWLAGDNHGTADITIDSASQGYAIRRQDPFGSTRGTVTGNWPAALDKGFVGGTTDPTGLTHLGAREYDPTTGRFISTDPEVDASTPQQLDSYAYGNNAPPRFVDATGRRFVGPCTLSDSECGGAKPPVWADPNWKQPSHEDTDPANPSSYNFSDWERQHEQDLLAAYRRRHGGPSDGHSIGEIGPNSSTKIGLWEAELCNEDKTQCLAFLSASKQADDEAKALANEYGWFTKDGAHDGRYNAFRHAYWMALLTSQGFSPTAAMDAAMAHELDSTDTEHFGQPASRIDMRNNETGINVGLQVWNSHLTQLGQQGAPCDECNNAPSPGEVELAVLQAMDNGAFDLTGTS